MRYFPILILILICNSIYLFSEEYYISGNITNKLDGKPIVGATIRIDKTNIGTYSDKNGFFKLNNLSENSIKLIISSLSYNKYELELQINENRNDLIIKLSPKSIKTNDIIVSANKRVQTVQEIPITIATINSNELENKSINSLEKALEYIPGIQINKENVSLRGSSGFTWGAGSRIALNLDGLPMLSADNGDMKFDALPLYATERIEVIKGAGSALYGTSAIGGVINIITKSPKPELSLKAKVYSGFYSKPKYDEWEYSDNLHYDTGYELFISKSFGNLGVLSSITYLDEQSYRDYDKKQLINSFAKINYKFNAKNNIDLLASFSISEADDWGWWQSLSKPFSPPKTVDKSVIINSNKYLLGGNYNFILNENNFGTLRLSTYHTFFKNNAENIIDVDYRTSEATNFNPELQLNSKLNNELFLTYGFSFANNTIAANIFSNNSQQIYSAYSQLEYKITNSINTNIGFRLDKEMTKNSIESPLQISPKFGLTYFQKDWKLFTSIGKGFRTPVAAERFPTIKYNGIVLIQNPELKPETSWSFEIGGNYTYEVNNLSLITELSLFQNHFENFINPEFNATNLQFNNVSQARIRGLELSLKAFVFEMIGLEGTISALDPINHEPLGAVNYLKYRSKFLFNGKILVPLDFLELILDYKYVSKVMNVDKELSIIVEDSEARVPAHVVDLRIIYDMKKQLNLPFKIVLNGFNVFDYYYTQMVGNMAPTRHTRLQIEYSY